MVDIPRSKITNKGVAAAYRMAAEIFKKPLDERFYEELQRNGTELLESGIEKRMEPLKFYACTIRDDAQFWVETRNHRENYTGKHDEFEKAVKKYFA